MFWNKKESEVSLPDIPPVNSPFTPAENNKMMIPKKEEEETDMPEKHSLPSFPDSPMNKGFSQIAIKEAVSSSESPEEPAEVAGIPSSQKTFKTIEVSETAEMNPSTPIKIAPHVTEAPIKSTVPATAQLTPSLKPKKVIIPQKEEPKKAFERSPIPEFPVRPQPREIRIETKMDDTRMNYQKEEKAKVMEETRINYPKPDQRNLDIYVKIDKFYSAKKSLEGAKDQLDQIEDLLKKIRDIKMREEQELEVWEKELLTAKARIQEVGENIFEKQE